MWKKKLKFGYIKGKYSDYIKDEKTQKYFMGAVDYVFKVYVVKETDVYEIKYGENMSTKPKPASGISGLRKVVGKEELYGVHEEELNWFQRLAIFDKYE